MRIFTLIQDLKKQKMIKKISTVLVFLCIAINVSAQEWLYTTMLESSGDFNINSTALLNDSTIAVFGTFKGKIEAPADTTSRGGTDIFIAVFKDGVFQWLQSIGSSSNEFAGQMIVYNNEIYLTGSFANDCYFPDASFLTTEGANDVFLAKFSSTGSLLLSTKIVMGANNQVPLSLDIDKNNELVLTGFYKDTVGFGTVGYDGRSTKFTNFFAKFDLNGNHILSKVFDGNNNSTRLSHIKAFDDGYYITGTFLDSLYLDVGDIVSRNATADVFLYKLSYAGVGQWVQRTYGNFNDVPGSITQDNSGNNYFTGFFRSDTIIADSTTTLKSTHDIVNNNTDNSFDFFIFKYNKSGVLMWSKGYGSEGNDWARSIETRNGFVYLSGYFSDTLVFQDDTISASSLTDEDPFIGIFNAKGNKIKAISVKGSGDNLDHAQSINLNSKNQAIISGFFESPALTFNSDNILTNSNPGTRNLFVGNYVPPFSVSFTKFENITCNNGTNGELIVTPYFGVSPYSYTWSHNGLLNDSTATGLAAGTYTVTVKDALDSTDVAQYTLTEPEAFIFNPSITQVTTCSYSLEGAINLNVTGGNGSNTYLWTESEGGAGVILANEHQTSIATGRYDVTVTDSKACTGDTTIYITGPDPISFGGSFATPFTGADPINTGAINLQFVGGTGTPAAYSISWEGPLSYTASTKDIIGLVPGNYTVTVTDEAIGGCDFDTIITVLDDDKLFAYISDKKDDCTGGLADGRATVSYYTPNATPSISYEWSNGATTETITGLLAGKYKVTVTDNSIPETSIDSVEIFDLGYSMSGNLSGTSSVDCKGDSDGYIDLSITSPGQLPYIYNWSNGSSSQDILNLVAGTYSVTVIDDNECTFSLTDYIISEPTDYLVAIASIESEPSCNGDFNGEIRVDATGGNNAPYTYQWDDPGSQTSQIANGLDAGFYSVTVSDSKGCTTTDNISLTQPDILTGSASVSDLTCFNDNSGTIDLTVEGGTPIYNYSWTTVDGSGLIASDKNQSNLAAGTYNLTITDGNLCETTDAFLVTEPSVLEITNEEKTDVSTCNGDNNGTITITAGGGTGVLTYTLNPGAIQTNNSGLFTGLFAGTYTVDVEDENGCGPVTSSAIEISEPTVISIAETAINDVSCNGLNDGSIDITVSGGIVATVYSYSWATADGSGLVVTSEDQTGLASGTYNLTVMDDNLCTATTSILISEPLVLSIAETSINDISCNGLNDGSIDITVSGGTVATVYSYSWATADGSGLAATSEDQTGLASGTYNLTVSDDNLCTATTSILISEPLILSIAETSINDISCNGLIDGSIDITTSGGTVATVYSYSWATADGSGLIAASEDQTGLGAGTYNLTVTDDNLCTATASILISDPLEISITETSINDISCNGLTDGGIDITTSGGTVATAYSYSWATTDGSGLAAASEDQTGLGAGTYNLTVSDDNSCTETTSILISEPLVINIAKTSINDISCNGLTDGSIDITTSGGTVATGYSYSWATTDGSGLIVASEDQVGLGAGTYNLTVSDDNLCTATTSVLIYEPLAINIAETLINDISCNGLTDGSINITVSGGTKANLYAYSWSTTNGAGLNVNKEDQFGLSSGIYDLTVSDDNLCVGSTSIEIIEPTIINLVNSVVINPNCFEVLDGSIYITVSGGTLVTDYSYDWSSNDGLGLNATSEDQIAIGAGTYNIIVRDDRNCASGFSFILNDPQEIKINTESVTNATGSTSADGTISIIASGGTGTLLYNLNPGDDSNQTGIFNGLLPGDYTVDVTDDNNCGPVVSNNLKVSFPDAINDDLANRKIKMYPNPTSDKIFIEIDYNDNFTLSILSISGQILLSKEIKSSGITIEEIDLSRYSKGIYFIRIYNNRFNFEDKILLQ